MKTISGNFLFLLFFFSTSQINAQWYDPEKVNKKANELHETAYSEVIQGKYDEAIAHLSDALKADPKFVQAYISRGDVYTKIKNYAAAISDYETAYSKDSVYMKPFFLSYANAAAGNGNFEKALSITERYSATPGISAKNKAAAETRKKNYQFAVDVAAKRSGKNYVFNPFNLGDSINSTALEYLPSITVDGNKMIFNRRINSDEDFYESIKVNGVWQHAKMLAGRLNTNYNEGAQNISQDGGWLIFTGCNYPEGSGSCDLYISFKGSNGEWSEGENLGRNINTEAWESSPSLSPDKRDLYFASTRPGGMGGSDIWIAHRNAEGRWSKPENAGPQLNTAGDEGCPFIHADNQTLYFNSNGRAGYGQTDLYIARKNAAGKWQEPENLGYPVNTIGEESSLIVSADGKTGYYASDKGNYKNGLDLYSFELRDDIRALKTLFVKGKIYDKKTNAGLPSSVELTTLDSAFVLSKLQTDADGNYLTTLPSGKNYAFTVNRKGYLFYSENFSLSSNVTDSPMVINIALQPLETGASVVLKNIFFPSKKFELDPASYTELDKVAALMAENPKLIIQISGYTDNVGKPADNLLLSVNRAKAVLAYLQSKGADTKRITGKGFGEANPVAENNTEDGRSKNRRTELTIISN